MLKLNKAIKRTFTYEMITTRVVKHTKIIQLNRPKALNALCNPLIDELNIALKKADDSSSIRSIIITGNTKAFAAGADIKDMVEKDYSEVYRTKYLQSWNYITQIKKPIIAAVSGYALGGGFELAMMCDIIIATRDAQFGLPELKLGTIPGAGGTQRLIREIGKSKAMEMILTGDFVKAEDMFRMGLVSRLVDDDVVEGGLELCKRINDKSIMALLAAKDCVNKSYEMGLTQGLEYEKRVFWGTFATEDRKEGMTAFAEKRKAEFKDK